MNKRIGSMQTGKVSASKSRTALSQTVVRHYKKNAAQTITKSNVLIFVPWQIE
jgi:hypothetical protein